MRNALIVFLVCYSQLLHIGQIIPEQIFFDHHAIFPMPHRAHSDGELLARGFNELPIPDRHGLGKGAGHYAYYGGPFPRSDFYRVNFYVCIGRIDEHRLEVFDMLFYAGRVMPVRPVDFDIFRMAFVQPRPFLIAEDHEIQFIEGLHVLFDGRPFIGELLQFLFHLLDLRLHFRRVTRICQASCIR
jgi:hypothetical protein